LGTLAAAFNGIAVQLQNLCASSEAKNQEAELARIEAVETSKAKSRFLVNMSFDFRCALNPIIGYSGMLEEELLDLNYEKNILDLQVINKAALHLLSIINDILNVSKIEAGTINLYLEVSEISAIINDLATKIQPVADKKCNILTANCPQNIGTAYTDVPKIS
jgi:signal transduction histidine kinase